MKLLYTSKRLKTMIKDVSFHLDDLKECLKSYEKNTEGFISIYQEIEFISEKLFDYQYLLKLTLAYKELKEIEKENVRLKEILANSNDKF